MDTRYETRKAWRVAGLLLVFMMINFVDKIVIGLLALPIMTELKLTPTQFGLLSSSFFWLFAVGGISGGFLANRVPSRWILLIMAIAWSLCQIPLVMSTSLAVFVIARVVLGVAEGPAYPVAIHATYKWFPPTKRILPISLFGTAASVGLIVSGLLVPLIAQRWGWRTNFILLAVIGLLWSILWLRFGQEGQLENVDTAPATAAPIPYRKLLADPSVFGSMLLHFVSYWGLALTLTWLPVYLQKGLNYDARTSGQVYALVIGSAVPITLAISAIVQRCLARGASSRMARGQLPAICQLMAGVLFVCLLVFPLSPGARVFVIAISAGIGPVIFSTCPAVLAEVTPSTQRGAVLAIDNSCASIAGILAPLLTGWLVEANVGARGYEMAFALSGGLMMIGSVLAALLINPEKTLLKRAGAAAERQYRSCARHDLTRS